MYPYNQLSLFAPAFGISQISATLQAEGFQDTLIGHQCMHLFNFVQIFRNQLFLLVEIQTLGESLLKFSGCVVRAVVRAVGGRLGHKKLNIRAQQRNLVEYSTVIQ